LKNIFLFLGKNISKTTNRSGGWNMKKDKNIPKTHERVFDYGTHPGAYITDYDINNELLDTVDCTDDDFKNEKLNKGKRANSASLPAADPPVPNRAHTGM
jgi:hypothetical protein